MEYHHEKKTISMHKCSIRGHNILPYPWMECITYPWVPSNIVPTTTLTPLSGNLYPVIVLFLSSRQSQHIHLPRLYFNMEVKNEYILFPDTIKSMFIRRDPCTNMLGPPNVTQTSCYKTSVWQTTRSTGSFFPAPTPSNMEICSPP